MEQMPSSFFSNHIYKNYDYRANYKNQELSTLLVAMKEGNIYPVNIFFTAQCTAYFRINNKNIRIDPSRFTFYNGYASIGGYKIIDTNIAKLDELLAKEQAYLEQCKRGIELVTQRIANFTNLKSQYPELFI